MAVGKILRSNDGQVVAFVAVALVVLGLLVGLAVDSGRAYLLQARLSKLADAVALAGAKAMQNAATPEEAIAAACDVAVMNGYGCGAGGPAVSVTIGDIALPGGTVPGITVTASDTIATSFMSLGTLIGCATCGSVTVAATASAVSTVTPADVVLVMDDTQSMSVGCDPDQTDADCPNFNARLGAIALVDALLPDGSPSDVLISMVPFRGCYDATDNICVRPGEIVDLTDDTAALTGTRGAAPDNGTPATGIQGLWAQGGSGTNICSGIQAGRTKLFGAGSRPNAAKILIILTDLLNELNPPGLVPCTSTTGGTLDIQTNSLAAAIKAPPDNVKIFVLGYNVTNPPNNPAVLCNPSGIGSGASGNDRNLGKCIASSTLGTNDHYFEAATPEMIGTEFEAIAEALKTLRLVK